MLEIVGLIGSVLVLISMCFKTSTIKSGLYLRIFNLVGTTILSIYGILLPTFSIAFLNIASSIVNIIHIINLCKLAKKEKDDKK